MTPFSRIVKAVALATLLGFCSILADLHLEETSPQQADSCCMTCCPAHHLAPSPVVVSQFNDAPPTWQDLPVIRCLSVDLTPSVFHPPQIVS
ncbi:MAG TPA: hypothetical protein VFX30_02265 [bacterium]|nr:hypothetical protein [bacterium]